MFEFSAQRTHGRQQAYYVTSEGSKIPVTFPDARRLRKPFAIIASTFGVLALALFWVPLAVEGKDPLLKATGMLLFGGAAIALALRMWGQPLNRLIEDKRVPVLYLRSFADDEGLLGSTWKMFKNDCLTEETLCEELGKDGPIFAVGRPGELIPPLGAVRIHVSDEHWQQLVSDLMLRSRAVVLRAGASEGLHWELSEAARRIDPTRFLLFLPFEEGSEFLREAAYTRFRETTEGILPTSLPDRLDGKTLVYFDAHWLPALLRRDQANFTIAPADKRDAAGAPQTQSESTSHPLARALKAFARSGEFFKEPSLIGRILPLPHGLAKCFSWLYVDLGALLPRRFRRKVRTFLYPIRQLCSWLAIAAVPVLLFFLFFFMFTSGGIPGRKLNRFKRLLDQWGERKQPSGQHSGKAPTPRAPDTEFLERLAERDVLALFLDGSWAVVSTRQVGKSTAWDVGDLLIFDALVGSNRVTVKHKSGTLREGSFKLYSSELQGEIDLVFEKGKETLRGVCRLDPGTLDRLTIAMSRPGGSRPGSFDPAEGREHVLLELRKEEE